MKNIGENLKKAIKNSKYTQKEIADKLKITRESISNYARNNSLPRLDILIEICELIEVPIQEVIYGIDENNINEVLISKFNKLTEEQQERVIEQIELYELKNSKMSQTSTNTKDISEEKSRSG